MGEEMIEGKGIGEWIWWKDYILLYENGKMRHVVTIPGMGKGENKREWWRGWVQPRYIMRTFVNVTMYPSTTIIW
jgi:hypothetical protein